MEAKSIRKINEEEEAQAQVDIWEYVFGFTPMAVVKCAVELKIADILEIHGGSMTHTDLSIALNCSPSILHRIMRYLIHRGFFKQNQESSEICYIQTALSRLLMTKNEKANSMADFILLESSHVMLSPWLKLSSRVSGNEDHNSPFEAAHGKDVWAYASSNPGHSSLINGAMASHARVAMSAIVDRCPEAFEGVGCLVDVGGGDGTALRTLMKSCPLINRGINFDLPHVVSVAPEFDGVENVGGDMFQVVPKADAAFLMWVLHDWSDEECIVILRKCREAIPEGTGKVIIAEAVIGEKDEVDKYRDVRLALDMVMLAHTEKGKERSIEEWEYVVKSAGFKSFTVKHIHSIVSVIQAYP
ncbi:hypothetical protein ABFS83_14G122900 [Erythranthe nasuta]